MKNASLLLERASLQDRVAERAAELAQEAERSGQQDTADICWRLVIHSRVRALALRALAEACKTQMA